jgi:hypothetical protein
MSTTVNAVPALRPLHISLDQFISTIFKGCPGVVGIAHQTPSGAWPLERWAPPRAYPQPFYFCISTVKDNPDPAQAIHRRKEDCVHTAIIVLDDIGTKIAADKISLAPSYIMETSAGNYQYGYRLTAPANPAEAAALIDALADAGFTDKGATQQTRVVRLPGSKNTKPGKSNFISRVMCWHPERAFTLDELAKAFGVTPGVAASGASQAAVGPKTVAEARAYEHTDEILAGLDRLGMVRWDDLQGSGFIGIECPWAGDHSFHDLRTGFNPELVHGNGFKCFHSHEKKSDHDVKEWLREKLGDDEWGLIEASAFAHRLKQLHDNPPFSVVDDPTSTDAGTAPGSAAAGDGAAAAVDKLTAEILRNTPRAAPVIKHTWRSIGASLDIEPVARRPEISPLLIRGAVTQIGSPPNAGKSQLAIALAVAIAAEKPELVGDTEPYKRTGDVFIVSNEDPADEVVRRRNAFMLEHKLGRTDLKREIFVNNIMGFRVAQKLDRYAPVTITPELEALGSGIDQRRSEGHDVCAVIVDTQASVLGAGLDENSNSDLAAVGTLLASWCEKHSVAMLILHHTTKDAARNRVIDMTAMRGASAMIGSVRIAAQLVPLSLSDEEKLDEAERGRWVELVVVKASYARTGGHRWFRKSGVPLPTVPEGVPDESGVLPMQPAAEQAGTLVYRKSGPDLGAVDTKDDDVLLNALARIAKAAQDGKPMLAKNGGRPERSGSAVLGPVIGNSKDRSAVLRELARRGWATRGTSPGYRGSEVEVWLPTDEGARALDERIAEIEGHAPASAAGGEPTPSEPQAEDTTLPATSVPGAGAFDDLEITFG